MLLLPVQLQSRLSGTHGSFQASDLAHARSVGFNRVDSRIPNAVGLSEPGMVRGVKRFETELQANAFRQPEVLARRKVDSPLARRGQDSDAGIAVVAQVLA